MDYLTAIAEIVLVGIFVAIVSFVVVVINRTRRRGSLKLSRDDAEDIALERISQGSVVGSRFTKNDGIPVWEFDILENGIIHRVQVGATVGKILNEQDLPARQKYGPSIGTKIPERSR